MDVYSKELDLKWVGNHLDTPDDVNTRWGKNFGFDYYYPLVSRSPQIKEILNLIKKITVALTVLIFFLSF